MSAKSAAFGLTVRQLDTLIVEDSGNMRLLLRTLLNSFEVAAVDSARDGEDALKKLRVNKSTNLIISDWEMPSMNGREFLYNLRHIDNEPMCFLPVIVLTGHASRSLVAEAFEAGATHLLVKPVTPASLLQRIEWVLEDDRLFDRVGDIYRQPMHFQEKPKRSPRGAPAANLAPTQPDNSWAVD